jgi:hypothetical protein
MALFDNPASGIYIGEVVTTADPALNGRLNVYIPALHKDKSDDKSVAYFNCIFSSPFAGSTNYANVNVNGKRDHTMSQKSYGMWMVPPDVGNQVLVAFSDTNLKYPVILSCLFPEDLTHMVPGAAGNINNYTKPGFNLPVSEKNKFDSENPGNSLDSPRPAHLDYAKAIYNQGLIGDGIRGASYSSARRESPSSVFGILTPGNFKAPIDGPPIQGNRSAGHSFVMDDGDQNGQSKNIRLRTGGGNQILMDDNEGIIYFINKDGKAWMELDSAGNITIFGEGDVDVRAKGNFNLRADRNVNIEAGGDVNIKAAGDTATGDGDQHVGSPKIKGTVPLGYGGNLRFESTAQTSLMSSASMQMTSYGGDIDINSAGRTAITGGMLGVDVNTLSPTGIRLQATAGLISSMAALGTTIQSVAPISLSSPMVLLNSPGGLPAVPSVSALTSNWMSTNTHDDWSSTIPDFGESKEDVIPNTTIANPSGRKKGPKIKSIVSTLPTAEPYLNHTKSDAINHQQASLKEGDNEDGVGAYDTQTPDGTNTGT